MKSSFRILLTSSLLTLASFSAYAQVKLPAASSAQTVTQGLGIENVTLNYSRPNKNGRQIFGGLVPFDVVWRTGANTNTTLTFEGDVTVEGHLLKAGTYALFTIPTKNEWTVIFSKNAKQWGAYQYDAAEDALRFNVSPKTLANPVETFTIAFEDVTPTSAMLVLSWDKTAIQFPLRVDQRATILASIDKAMQGEKKPYFQAAQYYLTNGLDSKQAIQWFDEAVKAQPNAPHVIYWKAKAQLKSGDKKGAAESAKKGIELAKAANNDEYVQLNTAILKDATGK